MKVLAMERRISTLILLCMVMSGVAALNVVIPQKTYEHLSGDNITLPCTFTTKQGSPPRLAIISWTSQGTEAGAKETLILVYYSTGPVIDIKRMYKGRVDLDVDLATGKANLKLSQITQQDNKLYECRVQIPMDDEGKTADTTRLVVLDAPSEPICELQGTAEYGQDIKLTCRSEEGFPPPVYMWQSKDVWNRPRVPAPGTTDKGGILSLYNISKETSGYYICISRNKIRSASCSIALTVRPPSMNIGSTGVIVGAIGGAIGWVLNALGDGA
ncbi:cell surface A33 antigen-like [Centropristis striata]|uniref:cell surface A33 antigen-like n=1 Tax=Centropristis striata TaxID=184440 RepID=UPI0027E1536D|nr:cell surface A33 antigen-like [Centropristis striata]